MQAGIAFRWSFTPPQSPPSQDDRTDRGQRALDASQQDHEG